MSTLRAMRYAEAAFAPLDRGNPAPPPAPRKNKQPEAAIQGAVTTLLRLYENQGRLVFWPVPNGLQLIGGDAKQRAIRASILRDRGLRRPGVPDIGLCLAPAGRYACIELKAPGGSVSPAQVHFAAEVQRSGGYAAVCRSVDEVKAVVDGWLAAEAAAARVAAANAAHARSEAV